MYGDRIVVRMLSERAGYDVTTPAGASKLACDIESVTGEPLSVNTIKRITGVIESGTTPRMSTLDIIARYLGFTSWKILYSHLNNNKSGLRPHLTINAHTGSMILVRFWLDGEGI